MAFRFGKPECNIFLCSSGTVGVSSDEHACMNHSAASMQSDKNKVLRFIIHRFFVVFKIRTKSDETMNLIWIFTIWAHAYYQRVMNILLYRHLYGMFVNSLIFSGYCE